MKLGKHLHLKNDLDGYRKYYIDRTSDYDPLSFPWVKINTTVLAFYSSTNYVLLKHISEHLYPSAYISIIRPRIFYKLHFTGLYINLRVKC